MQGQQLQEEIQNLQGKLQKTSNDFQAYVVSTQQLESFLEQQKLQKDQELITIKQRMIDLEQHQKVLQQEIVVLRSDNAVLQRRLRKRSQAQIQTETPPEAVIELQNRVTELQTDKNQLSQKMVEKSGAIVELTLQLKQKNALQSKVQLMLSQLTLNNRKIEELQAQNERLIHEFDVTTKYKQEEDQRSRQIRAEYQSELKTCYQKIRDLENKLKERDQLIEKKSFKNLAQKLQQMSKVEENIIDEIVEKQAFPEVSFHCLLLTKLYYKSPFLDVCRDKHLIKIYKANRGGTFQRSIPSYKHSFDSISFQSEQMTQSLADRIMENSQKHSFSVIFYGIKKSTKKYLMSALMVLLKQFVLKQIQTSEMVEASFLKCSQEEEKNLSITVKQKKGASEVIDRVIALGFKNPQSRKGSLPSSRRIISKPKVRYFSLKTDHFFIEIGSSSHVSVSFKDKPCNIPRMLDTILYSKIPQVSQPSQTIKQLILTLNPIVQLYEECKNTLSVTCSKSYKITKSPSTTKGSPVRRLYQSKKTVISVDSMGVRSQSDQELF